MTLSAPNDFSMPFIDTDIPLLDYQREGALFHLERGGRGLCSWEMGMGKTALGCAVALSSLAVGKRLVLVCPPTLTINWQREMGKFASALSTAIVRGQRVNGRAPEASDVPSTDVVIVATSIFHHWVDALSATDIDSLIVDESHRVKSKKAQVTRAVTAFAGQINGARLLLSGTPEPNGRIMELECQYNVIGDLAWNAVGRGDFFRYFHHKVPAGTSGGRTFYKWEQVRLDEFHERTTSFTSRRRRDPNKDRLPVTVPMNPVVWKRYEAIEKDLIATLASDGYDRKRLARIERSQALVKIGHLRRLAGEGKVDGIVEFVERLLADDEGVLVVAENNDVMDALTLKLARHNPATIRGGLSTKAKMEEADFFHSGQTRLLIGQIDAVGVGYTLTGNGLNANVVMAQLPWTPAQLRQAEDRLDRISQTRRVTVHVMLASDPKGEGWSVDERLFGILDHKYRSASTIDDGLEDQLLEDIEDGLLATYGG